MAATKNVNYTAEQTTAIVAAYGEGVAVEAIAEQFGKSVRSIIAKLSREGVYKAKERTTKTGAPVVKKDALVDAMQLHFKLTEAEADSLTKANKTALAKILQTVIAAQVATVPVTDLTGDSEAE